MQPREKADSSATQKSIAAPSISLPKGGGAIRGIGEKFSTNVSNGTASLSVPLPLSPGRSGFGPQISLAYDSGAGNGPFGLGWTLSLPSITRKTDQGLPRYNDIEESDVFIISGAEDLVPVLVEANGQWSRQPTERNVDGVPFRIDHYRPRIEGLFARIERWTNLQNGTIHWRSISRENITTLYGNDNQSRIFDPDDPTRIYRWLISETFDDKGNLVRYEYKAEDSEAVALTDVHERNRSVASRSAERYLKRIRYGNRVSRLIDPQAALSDWMFEVVFDYGEHDAENPSPNDDGAWLCRHDPFSTYRAGFEIRTYRLCQRVLMFHHFPDDAAVGQDCLVRSTDFTYRNMRNHPDDLRHGHPIASFLASITQCGYRRQGNGFLRRTMPPLECEYSSTEIHEELREIELESLENLPYGIDENRYQWLDLDGEGASGIVMKQASGWFYKRNLSPLNARQNEGAGVVFSPVETVARQPSLNDATSQMFLDLAGDGQVDLVQFDRPVSGYFERTVNNDWSNFVAFESVPSISIDDANVKFVDLTGDGHADILISEDNVFVWYPSLGEAGFAPPARVAQALNEENGPRVVFSDPSQSIYLADLSGDGLTDLVRIRNGEVCYWPNLGYGKFGAKVTMDHAPWFEEPDQFDQQRIQLADIDGSGVADIIYLGRNRVDLYFNQSGNSWSEPHSLSQIPAINNLASVAAMDLLGNGTACLAWSSTLPGERTRSLRYIDLMGGRKPHLLVRTINNLGAETLLRYASSTSFYLEDKYAGRPWLTKLPFPVHVVDRVVTLDRIARNRFTTRYAYHHGYFDGREREFRGFGMVEQFDTEEFATLAAEGNLSNVDEASHVPPVVTRSWFHTGALIDAGHISRQFKDEYYREGDTSLGESELSEDQLRSMLVDDTVIPNSVRLSNGSSLPWTITPEETLEAARSLKGALLRQEIYALDNSEASDRPYTVSEQNYTIEILQPRAGNQNAVFFTHARETIDFQYERSLFEVNGQLLADPRVAHSLVLGTDIFGNVTNSVAIAYGRRHPDQNPLLTEQDHQRQQQIHLTCTTNQFTNAVLEEDAYRTPASAESQTFELLNLEPAAHQADITNLFRFDEMLATTQLVSDGSHDIPYENVFGEGVDTPARRLIEHTRCIYRRDDLSQSLPLGQLESLAVPFEHYKLAFTPGLLNEVYGDRVTEAILANDGGYTDLDSDGNWWNVSGRYFFSPNSDDTPAQELQDARSHFFLPQRFVDPFQNTTSITFDSHNLLPIESRDALGNRIQSQNDYRVIQPNLIIDLNGNHARAEFDALGMVVGTAVMGKENESLGDSLDNFVSEIDEETIIAFLENPPALAQQLLSDATTRLIYDTHAYQRSGASEPTGVYTLTRETHVSDLEPNQLSRIQLSFSYSDGLDREIQRKIQAEAGPLVEDEPDSSPRWVGSGWTIFNNKGKPVRQYEPFFSNTHRFEFARTVGVSPILCYDPTERIVATIFPNHTWQKTVFNAWRQESWDVNDTLLQTDPADDPDVGDFFRRLVDEEYLPTWRAQRIAGQFGETQEQREAEQNAAEKASVHANTPSIVWNDSLGRSILTVAHNRFIRDDETIEETHATRVSFDIEGNRRTVTDPLNRIIARYDYDLLSSQIHSASMEAGERWILNDVTGSPIRAWNNLGHSFRTEHDGLRRPVHSFARGTNPNDPEAEILFEQTVYGETQGEQANHRGRVFQVFDGAGVVTNEAYDFKGNLLQTSRQLLVDYRTAVDWALNPARENEVFTSRTSYDALNRVLTLTAPDNTRIRPAYNEAGLLERVEANLRGEDAVTVFIDNLDYDARGLRQRIEYGNGARTTYDYDPFTFRLTALSTIRGADALQDLAYTYDPIGNITDIRDHAQQTIYFNNQVVEPQAEYVYDAIYRLIEAGGREHIGQVAQPQSSWNDEFRVNLDHPHNGQAMRRYTERYEYDGVSNLLRLMHRATDGDWTRNYAYNESSTIQPALRSNRLSQTQIGDTVETYTHDAHGNLTRMAHLPLMRWDFLNRLQATSQQVVNEGTPETTYYVYDALGQRIRKVTDRQAGENEPLRKRSERIYLGGFEIYREYEADGVTTTLERETLHVMDDQQRIALVETRTQGNDGSPAQLIRYQLTNHLDSAATELDHEANVISYEEYYPYGSCSYKAGRTLIEVSLKRYRHSAKERDEETGLSYHGARYYASWLGRWTAPDPSGIADAQNLYLYVSANPIKLQDPNGRKGKRKGYGGIRFSPDSQISAQQMFEMIQQSEKLTPWMKNQFIVVGNEIRLKYKNGYFPAEIHWDRDVPQWFKNTLTAVKAKEWYFSTGASIVSDKTAIGIIEDLDPDSRPVGVTQKKDDPSYGFTDRSANEADIHTILDRGAVKRKPPPTSRRPNEGLVIVTNRFQHYENKAVVVERDKEAIVATFFHELSSHAGVVSAKEPESRAERWEKAKHDPSYSYRKPGVPLIGDISPADAAAREVEQFFGPDSDDLNADYAKALGENIQSVGVITDLNQVEKISKERQEAMPKAINLIKQGKAAVR